MEKILRVDMTNGSIWYEELPQKYKLLGGRGLSSRLLLDEIPADCDPLSSDNKLIFAVGLLAGTGLSSGNRISVGCKSPLTGGIKEANGGGIVALRLAQQGIRALVIEGQAPSGKWYYLLVREKSNELILWEEQPRLGCFDTAKIIREKWGVNAALSVIGSAGEDKLPVAGIAHTDFNGSPTRYSARGGVGAVMGSKGLKAIVIFPAEYPNKDIVNMEAWREAEKKYHTNLQQMELTSKVMPNYGTALTMEVIDQLGGVPTRNFSSGHFDLVNEIGGEKMREIILERGGEGTTTHACMPGCIVRCSNRYPDQKGNLLNAPMEYENNVFLGSNLGIGNLDTIAQLNNLCNDYGVDAIETGASIAVAMEAGIAEFGDGKAAENLLNQIKERTELGEVLGQGAVTTGKHFNISRVVAFKGQTVGAYDPRAIKVNGVTYLTSPMGGDHTAGNGFHLKISHRKASGKTEISRNLQITSAWIDSLGLCTFVRGVHAIDNSVFPDLINSRYGTEWSANDLEKYGCDVIRNELEFNRLAGLSDTEQIPEFLKRESLKPFNSVWDIPDEEIKDIWKEF